jgi:hypothetical protein
MNRRAEDATPINRNRPPFSQIIPGLLMSFIFFLNKRLNGREPSARQAVRLQISFTEARRLCETPPPNFPDWNRKTGAANLTENYW